MTLDEMISDLDYVVHKSQMATLELGDEDTRQLLRWLEDYKSLKEHFDSLPDWIPVWGDCDEAMPECDGYYLAYYTFSDGRHAYDIVYFNARSLISNYITHWMPLPDPPKGDAE